MTAVSLAAALRGCAGWVCGAMTALGGIGHTPAVSSAQFQCRNHGGNLCGAH